MKRAIEMMDPAKLTVHPDIEAVPGLARDEYESLLADITDNGIQHPLTVDRSGQVLDGRHRLRAALDLAIEQVPVLVEEEVASPRLYALRSALKARNLTKSGKVLTLFLAHPDLQRNGIDKRSGNLKKGAEAPKSTQSISGNIGENATFMSLADEYGVPQDYFTILAKFNRTATEDDWAYAVDAIINDELSITRLRAATGGREQLGKKRGAPKYNKIAKRSAKSLLNVFKEWGAIEWVRGKDDEHEITMKALSNAFAVMPPEVRAVTAETVLEWPAHERTALMRALKEVRS